MLQIVAANRFADHTFFRFDGDMGPTSNNNVSAVI